MIDKKAVKRRKYLFIDGTNLYAGQYDFFGPDKYLEFPKFIKKTEEKLSLKFDKIYFYASYSPFPQKPTGKQKKYLKNEAIFYKSVKETKNLVFFKGYRSKTSGKEKQVDVKLTADIITYAFLNKYEEVFLMTGDADFIQALFSIRKFNHDKKISLICLENKIMYQGLLFFQSYVLVFKKKPIFNRKFKNVKLIKINSEELTQDI